MNLHTRTPGDRVVPFLISQSNVALDACVHSWQATIQPFHRRPSLCRTFLINCPST